MCFLLPPPLSPHVFASQKRKVRLLYIWLKPLCTLGHLCHVGPLTLSLVLKVKDDPRYKDFFRKFRIVSPDDVCDVVWCVCARVMYMRVGVLLVGGYDLTYSRQMAGRQPTTTGHGNAQQRPEPRLSGVSVPLLGWP